MGKEITLKQRKVSVLGLGKSGLAVAKFCAKRGASVYAMDQSLQPSLLDSKEKKTLEDDSIQITTGEFDVEKLFSSDLVVVSPGVSLKGKEVALVIKRGIPVIGEVELASLFIESPIVGITGTNGKSTVTTLCGEIASCTHKPVFCGGNLGTPLIECVDTLAAKQGIVVCEFSSFQLETIYSLRCQSAVILNVTPDHLDRYASMEEYQEAKMNIFKNQMESDSMIVNAEDEPLRRALLKKFPRRKVYYYTSNTEIPSHFYVESLVGGVAVLQKEYFVLRFLKQGSWVEECYLRSSYQLVGMHNQMNALAALMLMRAPSFVTVEQGQQGLSLMKALPHRMEWVAKKNGVDYYDDSKATNVDAVSVGITRFPRPFVLIAGGRDKGGDYTPLRNALQTSQVRGVILIGEAASKIAAVLDGIVSTHRASSLQEAVAFAATLAKQGDAVILSPACSSFDMFKNYEHRSQVFCEAVKSL